jgi:hypothetical protein
MRASPVARAGATWILLLLGAGELHADPIQWSYQWSNSPAEVKATTGTGYISLTDETLHTVIGDTDLVATDLQAHSTAPVAQPDVFTAQGYSLNLYLQDSSGANDTLTFTGQFDGTLTASSSNIANTFTGQTTQSVTLGDHLYTVTISSYTPPGPTGEGSTGSIGAHAEVSVQTIIASLPEPGSLMLSLVGASCLLLVRPTRLPHSRKTLQREDQKAAALTGPVPEAVS